MVQQSTIDTERLKLRAVTIDDAADLFECINDPEYLKYVPFKAHGTLDETKELIQRKLLTKSSKLPRIMAIVHKESDRMIGLIAFVDLNKRTKEAEVGYVLHPEYTNQGYMSEALRATINYGFKFFDVDRIIARCHPLNLSSQQVLVKAGLEFQDTENDHYGQIENLVFVRENKSIRQR